MNLRLQLPVLALLTMWPAVGLLAQQKGQAKPADAPAIDLQLAQSYFQDAARLFADDDGKLWGRSLAGPLLLVDLTTRSVVTNRPGNKDELAARGEVFVGKLPKEVPVANTSVEWAGVRWAMVMWPLPEDPIERRALLAHESWHRVQEDLGFPSSGADNDHLDTLQGRIWLQLECRALAAALDADDRADREAAIRDALLFRACRRSLFDSAASHERAMEMHEGLAEYTGAKLGCPDEKSARQRMARILRTRPATLSTFVRSFPYLTGPAYGLLLDAFRADWPRHAQPTDDLGNMLGEFVGFSPPQDVHAAAERQSERYDGQALLASETARETKRREQTAEFERVFLQDRTLRLPLRRPRLTFNPSKITPFGEHGTVYGTITLADVWGELKTDTGCLVSKKWDRAVISVNKDFPATSSHGPGWTLRLEPGWEVIQDPGKENSYTLHEKGGNLPRICRSIGNDRMGAVRFDAGRPAAECHRLCEPSGKRYVAGYPAHFSTRQPPKKSPHDERSVGTRAIS